MYVTKCACPDTLKANFWSRVTRLHKNQLQQRFFIHFHEFVCNIFSEILNRPFPDFKIITATKFYKNYLNSLPFSLHIFLLAFRCFSKNLIRLILKYIVDLLTSSSFAISTNLLDSLKII